ncbi:MAG: hypothetical protein AABX47_08810 [Nanoarchaeota archaeon]
MAEEERTRPLVILLNPPYKTRGHLSSRAAMRASLANPYHICEPTTHLTVSKIEIIKEYGPIERSMTPLNYPIRLGSDDFEGIQCIVSTLVDRYRGNFATSKSVTDYNTPLRYHGNGANHIQRILHAVILNGPIVHASLETFEGEPNATYLRVEIKEGSRALDHYAKNTMPLAYPPIARLLAVVTTISLPQPSRYHPRQEGGLFYLLGPDGQVL